MPCVTFCISVDFQIILSTYRYRPVAFTKPPYKCSRYLMLTLGCFSLLMSLLAYIFCFMVFGGLDNNTDMRVLVFCFLIIKALSWSPFTALEVYDTLFE